MDRPDQDPQPAPLLDSTDLCSQDTTAAKRRAFLLELLVQELPLGELLDLAAGHLPLIPLCTPNLNQRGCQQHGPRCEKPGKTPLIKWKQYQDGAPPSAADVQRWRAAWPSANWSLATGPASGILMLDQDGDAAAPLALPVTVRVRTGRVGGYHHYLVHPEGVTIKNAVALAPGWDVRSLGGLLILPGSLHPRGARYQVDVDSLRHGFAEVTAPLLAQLQSAGPSTKGGKRARLDMASVLGGVDEGERDSTLWRFTYKLRCAGVPEAWAERLAVEAAAACHPPFPEAEVREKVQRAYATEISADPNDLPDDSARVLALQAALDQERARNAELRGQLHALEAENAELRRRESETGRLITNIMDWQRDPSTRDLVFPVLALWRKRQTLIAEGKPPDTPIPWPLADLAQELGYHANTVAKWTKQLVEHQVVDQTYKQLGHPEDGDYRREQRLTMVLDLPDDLPDALGRIRRCVREERPPRKVAQPRSACEACQTARCPEHPDAPIQKHVAVRCTVCDGNAAPDHTHAPQRPSVLPSPVVLFARTRDARPPARGAESNHKNCGDTYVENPNHKTCGLTPPPADLLDQATAAADALAATLGADALPPADAVPLRLAILQECAKRLRAGQPLPTPTETCDLCGGTLGAAEFLRCTRCAHQEVA